MMKSIAMTQKPDTDYNKIRDRIAGISSAKKEDESRTFVFGLPGGRVITSMTQLSNRRAVAAMTEYLAQIDAYDKLTETLAKLRIAYANRDKSAAPRIISIENELDAKRTELKRLKNRVVQLEQRK